MACSSTPAAQLRPDAPTFAGASQSESCAFVEGRGEPYIVDWPADRRGKLEAALAGKIVVVAYDCNKLRVLDDCKVDGAYSFVGYTEKEQVLRLENADEVRANLPLAGTMLSARIGADLERGSTLDIALALVGTKRTAKIDVFKSELRGDCEGATHYVRGATIGAFAMKVGTRAKTSSVVDLFGMGASGQSSSAQTAESRDGTLDACRATSPSAEKPVAQCGGLVRLELKSIRDEKAGPVDVGSIDGDAPIACPKGMVPLDEGKCAHPAPNQPHLCTSGDVADCTAQCDLGSAGSCALLGRMYEVGNGVPRDLERAVRLLDKGCKGGATPACGRIGELLLGTPREEDGKKLLQRSCSGGWVNACTILGTHIVKTKSAAKVDLVDIFRRGCSGGDPEGCWTIGTLFQEGLGVRQNDAEAARYFETACSGGAKLGCSSFAKLLDEGKGLAPDPARAVSLLKSSCDRGYPDSCASLSTFYFRGRTVAQDPREGIALLTRACESAERTSCLVLGMRYHNGTGVDADLGKAQRYMDRACETGFAPACATAQEWRNKK
jgi:TPR repeat protein